MSKHTYDHPLPPPPPLCLPFCCIICRSAEATCRRSCSNTLPKSAAQPTCPAGPVGCIIWSTCVWVNPSLTAARCLNGGGMAQQMMKMLVQCDTSSSSSSSSVECSQQLWLLPRWKQACSCRTLCAAQDVCAVGSLC